MNKNKGVTLMELLIVIGLIAMIIPLYWFYINSSFEDNGVINDKILVQSSVNSLMNQVQKDIQEATKDISPEFSNSIEYGKNETNIGVPKEGEEDFLICKPSGASVLYRFNSEENIVTKVSNVKVTISDEEVMAIEKKADTESKNYVYINGFSLNKIDGKNGAKASVSGRISEKSKYILENEYYTRNTVLSSEI